MADESHGDFAAGERTTPQGPERDFAEGEEQAPPGAKRDFAEGEEKDSPSASATSARGRRRRRTDVGRPPACGRDERFHTAAMSLRASPGLTYDHDDEEPETVDCRDHERPHALDRAVRAVRRRAHDRHRRDDRERRAALDPGRPGFSQSNLAWVVNAYLIAFGGLLLLAGRMGDLIGQRRIFLIGLGVFTAASLLCAVSQSQGLLIAARFVQASAAH
jgi:hypothetical protein